MNEYPDKILNEEQLDEVLSIPSSVVIEMMKRLDGDLMILGINGKMGLTLGRQALNAIKNAGVKKKVIGVSRFTDPVGREKLERWGIETIACDLLDRDSVDKLPQVKNIIFMAGRKFGTTGSEELTWAMNTLVPANVGNHFR
ncbi:MAG: epimerase, partial [Candidatus Heimdallarchaeota archaeon]|nr:epimerase [Candidatus Heimdallarchaeota archaeon]